MTRAECPRANNPASNPACVPALPLAWTIHATSGKITDDLFGGQHVAHGAECVRGAVRHKVRAPSCRPQFLNDLAQTPVPILVPRNVVDDRAEQPVKQGISRIVVAWFGSRQPSVHNSEVAFEAQLCAGCGSLTRRIRLHDTATDHTVRALRQSRRQIELQLADFVAPDTESGAVVPLYPKRTQAKGTRQSWHRLHRGRQVRQADARKPSDDAQRLRHD